MCMEEGTVIVSMTTWPPRATAALEAMSALVRQEHDSPVRFVLTLSRDEWQGQHAEQLAGAMEHMGVEVLFDAGNTRSHKKLMPVLERYPHDAVIVVDDDSIMPEGWLQEFIGDHRAHPHDIVYGMSSSVVEMEDGMIIEGWAQRGAHTHPGQVTLNEKPANGAAGTLYPAGTFTDERFFDRSLYMQLSPTSDETWQWAWAVMEGRTFRCLSGHNYPLFARADQTCALFNTNMTRYTEFHNAIAQEFPRYREAMEEIIRQKQKKQEL